jgi:putative transposase
LEAFSDGECCVKKSLGQTEITERHAMIVQAHQTYPELSIRHLCSLLEVNRAWYYAKQHEQTGGDPDVALRDAIELIVVEFAGYGYRRVTHALKRSGWQVDHKRVLRVMREESLLCQLKRQFVHTTDSHHRYQVYPTLLATTALTAPNQAWAESFFKTLKREEVYLNHYQPFAEAQANSAQFIEDVYNTKR